MPIPTVLDVGKNDYSSQTKGEDLKMFVSCDVCEDCVEKTHTNAIPMNISSSPRDL